MQAADILHEHKRSDAVKGLPLHMKKAYKALSDDTALMTRRHFDAYARGNPRPSAPYTVDPHTPATPPDSSPIAPVQSFLPRTLPLHSYTQPSYNMCRS